MPRPNPRSTRVSSALAGTSMGGRLDVIQVGNQVFGDSSFGNCNHKYSFSQEADVADFLKGRIVTTANKMVLATALRWLEGRSYPLVVEGATLQDNKGWSSSISQGDRVFWRGIEAAHFGVGTVTNLGEPISIRAARGFLKHKSQAQSQGESTSQAIAAHGDLVRFALSADGSTYWAPTFINRTEGGLERILQPRMSLLIPAAIPRSVDLLEGQLQSVWNDTVHFLLDAYGNTIWRSSFYQDPQEVKEKKTPFKGDPAAFKDAIKAAVRDQGGPLATDLKRAENTSRSFIGEVTTDADAAKK
jgi:hypothetical protein